MVSRIGAAKSNDRGRTWQDLGAVIQARPSTTACDSNNRYIIGGVGDLSVMLDADKQYLYFFYSQYQQQPDAQGVAVARMLWVRSTLSMAMRLAVSNCPPLQQAKMMHTKTA